ncbi:ROK family transcriptional regulator, partial [Glycomyces salinus]|uniref:ROK family transcriptional regulator n=1 Tax=Glycomyces salinus TaxID=980294 RepID=UPI0018EA517C
MQLTDRQPAEPSGSARPLRTVNDRAALHHLLENGSLTRVELRELTGLAKPTASQVMRRLIDSGLAVTVGRTTAKHVGPKAEVYAVNVDYAFAGSATLREPHGITVAVADLAGHKRATAAKKVDFRAVSADQAVFDLLSRTAAAAGIDPDRIGTLHLAVPGAYDPDSDTIGHTDIPGLAGTRPRTALAERLRASIEVHNDVNAATVAERRNPDVTGGLA